MIPRTPEEDAVLQQAADYLEHHGWIQGGYADCSGAVCLLGAVRAVSGGDPESEPEGQIGERHECALECLRRELSTDRLHIWNDDSQRTKAQVLAALRGARGER